MARAFAEPEPVEPLILLGSLEPLVASAKIMALLEVSSAPLDGDGISVLLKEFLKAPNRNGEKNEIERLKSEVTGSVKVAYEGGVTIKEKFSVLFIWWIPDPWKNSSSNAGTFLLPVGKNGKFAHFGESSFSIEKIRAIVKRQEKE
ncbi:MAG: hypothetical protein L3J39_10935 [Verrucomicrobiales bacterium]|nr:hypothetical protein [Verrucomicrobiales bacterium]